MMEKRRQDTRKRRTPRRAVELSASSEDYLKAIYKLQSDRGVSTKDIAATLGVAAASVTNMVKRLAEMGLVEHKSYRGVRLTTVGEKAALEIIRHHRLLETYLREVMGYSWDQMHEEAERLEHHISEAFEDKIDEMLGYPTHDPHGHPIPARDGSFDVPQTTPLSDVPAGLNVVVHHIEDANHEVLDYLEKLGLLPRVNVLVEERGPFNGPLAIRIGEQRQVIGYELASGVFVSKSEAA